MTQDGLNDNTILHQDSRHDLESHCLRSLEYCTPLVYVKITIMTPLRYHLLLSIAGRGLVYDIL